MPVGPTRPSAAFHSVTNVWADTATVPSPAIAAAPVILVRRRAAAAIILTTAFRPCLVRNEKSNGRIMGGRILIGSLDPPRWRTTGRARRGLNPTRRWVIPLEQ